MRLKKATKRAQQTKRSSAQLGERWPKVGRGKKASSALMGPLLHCSHAHARESGDGGEVENFHL